MQLTSSICLHLSKYPGSQPIQSTNVQIKASLTEAISLVEQHEANGEIGAALEYQQESANLLLQMSPKDTAYKAALDRILKAQTRLASLVNERVAGSTKREPCIHANPQVTSQPGHFNPAPKLDLPPKNLAPTVAPSIERQLEITKPPLAPEKKTITEKISEQSSLFWSSTQTPTPFDHHEKL